MLLPREQSSWNCGYALGAYALMVLEKSSEQRLDLLEIQQKMSLALNTDLSMNQVVIALAWLYLLGKVELTEDGKVSTCA